jgi:hypothetical protein
MSTDKKTKQRNKTLTKAWLLSHRAKRGAAYQDHQQPLYLSQAPKKKPGPPLIHISREQAGSLHLPGCKGMPNPRTPLLGGLRVGWVGSWTPIPIPNTAYQWSSQEDRDALLLMQMGSTLTSVPMQHGGKLTCSLTRHMIPIAPCCVRNTKHRWLSWSLDKSQSPTR